MTSVTRRSVASYVLACLFLLPRHSQARRGARIRFTGRGLRNGETAPEKILSRSALLACMQDAAHINDRLDLADKKEREIKTMERLIDQGSDASVDSFNAAVDSYNSLGEGINLDVLRFNSACAGGAYYISDMNWVVRELKSRGIRTDHAGR